MFHVEHLAAEEIMHEKGNELAKSWRIIPFFAYVSHWGLIVMIFIITITLRHSHYVLLTVLFNGSCRAKWWLLNIHLRNNYRFNENTLIYFLFKV